MRRLGIAVTAAAALTLAVGFVILFNATNTSANHIPYAVGDVFAGIGDGEIQHLSPTGTVIETLDTGTTCNEQLGMAFDASDNLYATSAFGCTATVVKFDSQGGLIGPFGSGYSSSTESVAVDAAGNVYVGQPDGTADILKFDSTGAPLDSYDVPTEGRGSDWIDLAGDQCTMFYTSEGVSILRYDVCTDTPLANFNTAPLPDSAYALRILPDGGVLVSNTTVAIRLDSSGNQVQTYTPSIPASLIFALNLDPDGTSFWTADYSSGNVFKFDIASGTELLTFNVPPNTSLSGLAVFGEVTAAQPTPTPTPSPTATVTPTPTPTEAPAALPPTGGTPSDGSGLPWLVLAAGLIALASGGLALAYRTRRIR
ncbi:MAG: hypothetical protein Q8Q00_00720 [Dehalococcoidia bacterium]|nr:hypothetical protein [Dehalococcoidia bacterium]